MGAVGRAGRRNGGGDKVDGNPSCALAVCCRAVGGAAIHPLVRTCADSVARKKLATGGQPNLPTLDDESALDRGTGREIRRETLRARLHTILRAGVAVFVR